MTQNIYDEPAFFDGYSRLPRSVAGLAGAPEWPALRAMLPDLQGLRVLDLGCGFGWFARWARAHGAAHVDAIDVSQRMLERARADTRDERIAYLQADLEQIQLQADGYDFVYSSLVLHYLRDLDRILREVSRALVAGGRFVFSMEHPMFTAPLREQWLSDGELGRGWRIDSYLCEGPRTRDWLAPGVIKQHRSLSTYLNGLVNNGFALAALNEWGPTDAQLAAQPALADERIRPTFMLVSAVRSASSATG